MTLSEMKPWEIDDFSFDIQNSEILLKKFTFIDTSNLINRNDEIEYIYLLTNINKFPTSTGIMVHNLTMESNLKLYIFLFDNTILIIKETDLYQFHDYFNSRIKSLMFLTKRIEIEFLYFLSNNKFIQKSKEFLSISQINKHIIKCIIKKSQYRTLQNHYSLSSINQKFNNNIYNSDDLITIHNFPSENIISLCYNVCDQLLYIIKIYKDLERYNHEIQFYEKIENQYPYISKFFGFDTTLNIVYIEYIHGDTLYDFIIKNKEKISFQTKIKLILQILLSVEYIHSKKIILRDLKLDNIMVNSKYHDAILIDFDLTKIMLTNENSKLTGNIGCTIFAAPEQHTSLNYNEKIDIYSLGLIIHFILTEIPYDEKVFTFDFLLNIKNMNKNILDTKEFPKCPEKYKDVQYIYRRCFEISPNLRPNISEIINNFILYFDSYDQNDEIQSILSKNIKLRLHSIDPILKEYLQSVAYSNKFENNSYINLYELLFFWGVTYYRNKYVHQDIQKCINYLTIASDNNILGAQFLLGSIYYEGKYVQRNITKSIHLFKLVSNEYAAINIILGKIYFYGIDVPRDINKSIHYYLIAAKQNIPVAQYNVALIYLFYYSPIDINEGIRYLTLSANQNFPEAQVVLAYIYLEGNFFAKNANKALEYLTKAANQNYRRAYFMLGKIYYEGIHIERNIEKSLKYLKKAADKNDPEAQFFLGDIYFLGKYMPRNIKQSIYYIVLSANHNFKMAHDFLFRTFKAANFFRPTFMEIVKKDDCLKKCLNNFDIFRSMIDFMYKIDDVISIIEKNQKNTFLQYILGQIYYFGTIVDRDINKSISYFTLAANNNYGNAQYFIGKIYYDGEFVSKDIIKSIKYLTLSSNNNNQYAQCLLGKIYYEGDCIARDIHKSIYYLTFSSNQNNSDAQYLLGRIYYKNAYINRNINISQKYLTLSSNQNNMYAQSLLGMIYYEGKYVKKDIEKAIHYFTLSANQNYKNALHSLGIIYYEGKYVNKDINKAIHYLTLSANQNFSDSQYQLGVIFYDNINVPFDFGKAFYYFNLSANQQNPRAQCMLGYIYYKGEYISRDINKAIKYLTLSSDQQLSHAQYFLGYLLYEGTIIKKDINKSIHYLKLASNNNNCFSQYFLGNIYLEGIYVKKNINKAIEYLTLSANQNFSPAQYLLGSIYFTDQHGLYNIDMSCYYFELASEKNKYAAYILGCVYYDKKYDKYDIKKSIHFYKESSNLLDQYAKNNLGIIAKNGEGMTKSIYYAIELFNEAIKIGNDVYSLCNLARIYYFGIDIEKNIMKAISYLENASKYGFIFADFFLFIIYLDNEIKMNAEKRLLYFKKFNDTHNIPYYIFAQYPIKEFLMQYDFMYSVKDICSDFEYYMINKSFKRTGNEIRPVKNNILPINQDFYRGFYDD